MLSRAVLTIKGIVQGVGFRPYIFRLAAQYGLKGYVRNSPSGVLCEAEGEHESVREFIRDIPLYKPFASQIDDLQYEFCDIKGYDAFRILPTLKSSADTVISPDLAICDNCKRELFDANNRRYHYPFINCTDCGPRYSIIESMPYDRQGTSMSGFKLCPECRGEYEDPLNRRFHAEPNACPECGPHIVLKNAQGEVLQGDWLEKTVACLKSGGVAAIKGVGGYHLAADAYNDAAVLRLREMKRRYAKPFAVMVKDIETAALFCELDEQEKAALLSREAPIVILKKREGAAALSAYTAPGKSTLGLFLPYAPIHCLISEQLPAMVLTSANISDMPLCADDEEIEKIFTLKPDLYLQHDRAILHANDDSVLRFVEGRRQLIRRSRGLAPAALAFGGCEANILAMGAEQKNTFALSRGREAFLSVHIGDLGDYGVMRRYEKEIAAFERLLAIRPDIVACDMHPDYQYRAMLRASSLPVKEIQHHHAHFASVLAEHGHKGRALGIIFDGTGYGSDGTLWGSEFLVGGLASVERRAHLLEFPLYGGEKAIREPWRLALAMLAACSDKALLDDYLGRLPEWAPLLTEHEGWPLSCGMGRLFDAVASMLCDIKEVAYEGQAAEILEENVHCVVKTTDICYEFAIIDTISGCYIIDWRPLIADIYRDICRGAEKASVAAAFHRAVIRLIKELALKLCAEEGLDAVALSGGCFQNEVLLSGCLEAFDGTGLRLLINEKVPCNDGGIAYGQLAAAAAMLGGVK